MKRLGLILVGCLMAMSSARAGDAGIKQAITYVKKLQTDGGGFRAHEPKPDAARVAPTLRSTSAAVRALKYLGSDVPNKDACIKFVESCWDAEAGAFSDTPKGKPGVFETAVGLMAVVELKMPTDKYTGAASKYLTENAKTFEEIRIGAAGLESVKLIPAEKDAELWYKVIDDMRNKDGTFGKGLSQARDTASANVTIMRLRVTVSGKIASEALNIGQRQNGGWGKADSEIASDLETTYRVMRCYHMLKAKPGNVEGVRSFVARCRNEDGGYAVAPGQPSSVNGTYFGAIIRHWLKGNP